ncbi:MAG: hypothetical protein ACRDZ4_03295 [Egibacteraceae bacterium]
MTAGRLLQSAGRLSGGQAVRQARLASSLADPGLEVTAAALAAGRISPGQADALAQAARTHPGLVAVAQDELVAQASENVSREFAQWPGMRLCAEAVRLSSAAARGRIQPPASAV